MSKNKGSRHKLPAQPNHSLIDGLACLQELAGAERPMGSRELARELDLEPTRVNRLLGTLFHLGLAERTGEHKYVPGPGIHLLAAMSLHGSKLLSAALPVVERLRAAHPDLTAALGVLWRTRVAYLLFAEPGKKTEAAIVARGLFPAEKSSIGRALLAKLSDAEIRKLYQSRPKSEIAALLASLASVRADGFAWVDETTLGVALGEPAVAGLALAGKIKAADKNKLVEELKAAAMHAALSLD
jgi:DNA-binding IclR family transcriptional regulator